MATTRRTHLLPGLRSDRACRMLAWAEVTSSPARQAQGTPGGDPNEPSALPFGSRARRSCRPLGAVQLSPKPRVLRSPRMDPQAAQVLSSESPLVLGHWKNFFVVVYTGALTESDVRRLLPTFERFARTAPKPIGLYIVVEEQVPLPAQPVREEMAHFMKSVGPHVRASALVQEGDGFRAAAVRSVAIGINLVARQPYPHKVFASSLEAAQWLATSFPEIQPQELTRAVASIRRGHR